MPEAKGTRSITILKDNEKLFVVSLLIDYLN